ncbi:MAG TPA: hypothetical protein VNJ52_09770 [Patescibacteria group bacterium]|nr:hypothetical protein [Patescibacteria group bacterium]
MKSRRYLSAMLAALLAGLLSACGSTSTVTSVSVSPSLTSVILGGTVQFSATVSGPSDTTVSWSITGSGCSGTACGTIDTSGLYTAPSQIVSPNTVTITATSNADPKATATANLTLDSGVRLQISPTAATLGSNESYNFTVAVTGTTNTQVNWDVNATPNGNSSVGQVCVPGSNPCQAPAASLNTITYIAPASTLGTTQVTLTAISVADTTRQASVKISIMPAVAPAIASISPPATAQGAVRQEIYVNSQSTSNFFSTSTVLANGQPVPTIFLGTSLLRAQVPATMLQTGTKVQIAVEAQNNQVSNSIGLLVAPVRPSIVSFSPVSVPQCPSSSCGPASVTLDGGYFSPSTQVSFNGQSVGATLNNANQMAVSLPGTTLQTAGLYQLTLTNPGAAQPESAVNVAVEPSPAVNAPANLATATVGPQPSAVAVDPATGVAVVANSGSDTVSIFNVPNCSSVSCPATSVKVGNQPTGVAIDPFRHLAIVVNQGDNTLSLVDLTGVNPTQTIPLPAGYVPVSIGENPLTGHALVANQETNTVTVVDLSQNPATVTTVDVTQGGTRPGGTGLNPRVAIEPRLDWAIVTPGGAGAISAIDMSHEVISPVTAQPTFNVVFSFTISTTITGIALNPITDQLLLTDPNSSFATIFSLLDESVLSVTNANNSTVGYDNVASAVNPLTNVGLLVGQNTNSIQLVDLLNAEVIGSPLTVGNSPVDVAFDDVTDRAVVVNQADGTASVLSMGAVRPLAVTQASVGRLFTSGAAQTVTLIGGGFDSAASVRIDGTALPIADVQWSSSRQLNLTIPAPFLAGPGILNLDVQDSNGALSNVYQIPVIQTIPVGTAPVGVAIDPASNTAVVTNSGSDTVSLVDLSAGAVTATVDVGSDPLGVAVFSRAGQAVVANSGDDTVSLVDLCTAASANSSASCTPSATSASVSSTTGTVQEPVAVDIDPDSGVAAIANEQSNSVSFIDALTGALYSRLAVDLGPLGVAIDPQIEYAAVLCSTQSPAAIDIADLQAGITTSPAVLSGHIGGANLPTGIALDPVNDVFLVADSTGNRILIVDPQSNKVTQNIGTGINPTSIAYNFNALEAVTVNKGSHTASLVEITPSGSHVRAIMLVDGSTQQSVAINPLTNVAVVADQSNNQVLLVPLGH